MKAKIIYYSFIGLSLAVVGYLFLAPVIMPKLKKAEVPTITHTALAAKFDELSKNGNSSCSTAFRDSIDFMAGGQRIIGSCCSPMDLHRYTEQVQGLQKYSNI